MEILDKNNTAQIEEYERFNLLHGNFMQSLNWAGVKSNWDWEAVLSRNAEGELWGVCLVLIRKIPLLGSALMYAPHGPILDRTNKKAVTDIFEGIKLISKKYRVYRFICDPLLVEGELQTLSTLGFSHTVNADDCDTIQPRANYVLKNIGGKTEEELIAHFKSDYRNRIRKAIRKGVYCRQCGAEALDDFYPLMKQTGIRDKFPIRPREYFEKFMNSFTEEQCRIFMCYAEIDGKETPLSGAVAVRYGKTTTYVYGASSNFNRNLYPNYLMQFEMMKWAIEGGCDIYDFGGIPHYDDENNLTYGLFKFKKGFNGEVVVYAGEYEYDFRPHTAKFMDLCTEILHARHKHKMRTSHLACRKKWGRTAASSFERNNPVKADD